MSEKDLNYIAALEKAIKKKYGDEAIQNPASFWDEKKEKEYLEQLNEFVAKQKKSEETSELKNVNGVLISQKLLIKEGKLNCPVCSGPIKKVNDDVYMAKFECCEKCYIQYVIDREDRWLKGWRPKNVTKST